ncbi:MAG: PAS-domain containing protein [Alphaproteobacteria bacterium]
MAGKRQSGQVTAAWPWVLAAGATAVLAAAALVAASGVTGGTAALVFVAAAFLVAALTFGLQAQRHSRAVAAEQRRSATLDALLTGAPGAWYFWDLRDGGERRSPRLAALLGLDDGSAGFEAVIARFDGDGAHALSEALAKLRAGGEGFELSLGDCEGKRRFRAEGRLVEDGSATPVGAVLWISDISDLAAEIAAVRAERARLENTLDAIPLPLWRRATDLSLVYCNRAYADIVEIDAGTAVAGAGVELVGEAERAWGQALAREACEAGTLRAADHHVVVDGARRMLRINEAPLEGGTLGIAWDVTDVEDANRDLARHIAAHAEVLENLATAIAIFGSDRQLKFFNSAYARLWRVGEDWLRDEPTLGEILEALRATHRIADVPDFPAFKKKREAMFTDLIEPHEELLHLPDGTTLRMIVTPHPFGGLLFTFEDVTARLELERNLNTLIAVQRETLDNLYEGIAVFGSDGRLKLSNPGFARLWSLEPQELAGEPHIADVVERGKALYDYGDDWDTYKAHIVARTTDRVPAFDRLERRDQTVLHWASVPLPDGATLMTYLDVTDSIKVERALRERAEALEAADRLKTEFIASVSYELRTPLNTIIGFSELLDGAFFGELNARQVEYVKGILESSQQLLQLINDILDLASIEAGHIELDLDNFDIDLALRSVITLGGHNLGVDNVKVEYDRSGELGEMVGDEKRIKQVVFHLLTNAVKFSLPEGKVTLAVERDQDRIAIAVSDSGIGIADADKRHVFDRFWRGDEVRARRQGGGLGLALVKSFVELHGGEVELDSRPGQGTRVTCRLPVDARAALEAMARSDE